MELWKSVCDTNIYIYVITIYLLQCKACAKVDGQVGRQIPHNRRAKSLTTQMQKRLIPTPRKANLSSAGEK